MFRNARFYRFDARWPDTEEALSAKLAEAAFKPCGPLSERSSGWVAIDAGDSDGLSDRLARRVNGADLVRLRSQSRVLPAAAVNEALEARIEEFRERMGEAPNAREKRRLKAETRDRLLTQSLLRSDRIWGYIDPAADIVAIDAAGDAACERFLSYLREPFGELNLKPLVFREPVGALLKQIFLGQAPARFHVGRECKMQDAQDRGSTVRWSDFDLADPSIRDHVADGMHLTHLAIEYDHVLTAVLDQNGVLTKLKLLNDDDADAAGDDPLARLDADFVLLSGTLRRLLGDLEELLGGSVSQAA